MEVIINYRNFEEVADNINLSVIVLISFCLHNYFYNYGALLWQKTT